MNIKQIEDDEDYGLALKEIERLMPIANPDTPDGAQLLALVSLVEKYEEAKNFLNADGEATNQ